MPAGLHPNHFNRRIAFLLVLIGLMLTPTSAVQASSLTTISLQSRTADELIPILEPLLGAGDVITGQGYRLFLRAPAQTVEEVKQVVRALDIAARVLLISVSQGSRRDFESQRIDGNIQVESDNSRIDIGSDSGNAAGNIDYGDGNVSIGVSGSSNRSSRQSNPVHRLRVTEGTRGFIETGSEVAYNSGLYGGTTDFKRATTGFYVLPRVNGDEITLEVSPFKNEPVENSSGRIETQQARTTIRGRLGEWLSIGGVSQQFQRTQSGIGSRSSAAGSRDDSIWIKAELVR